MKRLPAQVPHRPDVNRLPEYFGLPEGWFHALVIAGFALWALAGFRGPMAVVAGGLAFAAGSMLAALTRKGPRLPWRRAVVLWRFAQPFPAVTTWSLW